jgi:hypothetical protein
MGICRSCTNAESSRVYADPIPIPVNKSKKPRTESQTEKILSGENGDISRIKNMPVTNQMDPLFPSSSLRNSEQTSKVLPTNPNQTKNSKPVEPKTVKP